MNYKRGDEHTIHAALTLALANVQYRQSLPGKFSQQRASELAMEGGKYAELRDRIEAAHPELKR